MAFSKNLAAYPPAFVELFEVGINAPGDFIVPCADKKQADRTRLLFYGIKSAIIHNKQHPLNALAGSKTILITKNNEVLFRLPCDTERQIEGESLLSAALAANQR